MILNLIDFDDTIALTNDVLFLAYQEAIFKFTNKRLTAEMWNNFKGQNYSNFCNLLKIDNELKQKIHQYKYEIYPSKYFNEILINTDLINYFCTLQSKTLNVICSNTKTNVINSILEYNNICFFDDIIGREFIKNAKPNPEIFEYAYAKYSNEFQIDSIIIYEDSDVGLYAAECFKKQMQKISAVEISILKIIEA